MSLVVLDASVVAAWALPSQSSPRADALLQEAWDHRFVVPHIFPIEVRALLLAAERRDRWRLADTEAALAMLDDLDLLVARMDDTVQLRRVMQTARAEGLSYYDSFYLHLADQDRAVLASRDKALLAAAVRRSIDVRDLNG